MWISKPISPEWGLAEKITRFEEPSDFFSQTSRGRYWFRNPQRSVYSFYPIPYFVIILFMRFRLNLLFGLLFFQKDDITKSCETTLSKFVTSHSSNNKRDQISFCGVLYFFRKNYITQQSLLFAKFVTSHNKPMHLLWCHLCDVMKP